MLNLPDITLIALTNKDYEGHKKALDESSKGITWGARKIIWDEDITSIDEWNRKMVYELHHYVQTPFAMVIHADGYVINPEAWRPEWLGYDYIGAPWPLPRDNFSYRDPLGNLVRVGNSVSLRSKRILELPSRLNLPWRSYYGYTNEDGFLTCHNRQILEANGIRYSPFEEAIHFSKEAPLPENQGIETFAFHHYDGPNEIIL
jgi:hypothetical protein